MTDQLTAVLTELKSLRNELTELKQMVKGNQPLELEDKLPITEGLEGRISACIQELKVPVHIKGYVFLREAVKMAVQEYGCVAGITKSIYPNIATKYRTTSARVERAIRHAIESSYKRNRNDAFYSQFKTNKPTNSAFIALVADRMILEEAKREAVTNG